MAADTLYDEDFVVWTERQAEILRRLAREGSNLPLDWDNLAEEVESLGKSDRREVESYLERILEHLIKLRYSPSAATPTRLGKKKSGATGDGLRACCVTARACPLSSLE
jgi:DNA polymerase III delta prime subunit